MNNYTQQLVNELNNSGKIPMFEISVINADGDQDWVTCDIFIEGDSIVAEHDALTSIEQRSQYIPRTKITIDDCFSLDEHLQRLYSSIIASILNGDVFQLAE
jgi:hypothetical protein